MNLCQVGPITNRLKLQNEVRLASSWLSSKGEKKHLITSSTSNNTSSMEQDNSQLLIRIAFADAIALTQLRSCGVRPESNKDEIWCSMLGSLFMRGEGKLSENTKHIQHLASIASSEGSGVEWGTARLITANVPRACQSNILKQHMQSFATPNYPGLGTEPEKHLWRTIKRAWLVVHAVSKCWQIVIFNEYTALEWPIKRSLSKHCSFVLSINFLCNSQISCKEIAISSVRLGKKGKISLSTCFSIVHCGNHRKWLELQNTKWPIVYIKTWCV